MIDKDVDEWIRNEDDKLVKDLAETLDLDGGLKEVLQRAEEVPAESLKVCPSCGLMIGHSDPCPVCND